MSNSPVYFDYNATTPLKPAVVDCVYEILTDVGNASSVHGFGRAARKRIEDARAQVAALTGAQPAQIVFNSGATEGNNTIIKHFQGERDRGPARLPDLHLVLAAFHRRLDPRGHAGDPRHGQGRAVSRPGGL